MIRYEPVSAILRFYPEYSEDPLAKYTASCVLVYETERIVWIKALVGTLTRKNLRKLLRFLLDNNIDLVKTVRASESLPLATSIDGNICEIDIANNREKFEKMASSAD
jgi:hypothetical protein